MPVWICMLLLLPLCVTGQSLSGDWKGRVTQEGVAGSFHYQLQLIDQEGSLNGYSFSTSADSTIRIKFTVTGLRDGASIILQEIQQLEPAKPVWCLKYAQLNLRETEDSLILAGNWQADGCRPGTVWMYRLKQLKAIAITDTIPFAIEGKWSGQLDQSDRNYGFFYEFELKEDGTGTSYIVSEGNGGSANHALTWHWDSIRQRIRIQEERVVERTDPRWKWCIKGAELQLEKQKNAYSLSGLWSGHIEENFTTQGKCAPGNVYLEKPILTRTVIRKVAENNEPYQLETQRTVKMGRTIEVAQSKLVLYVWDNGKVDGDVVTLFLNGQKIMDQYRVSKHKAMIRVELKADDNFLILHADDLGEIMPNTVAVSIYDGKREQTIIVSSNLRESGGVMVKRISQ